HPRPRRRGPRAPLPGSDSACLRSRRRRPVVHLAAPGVAGAGRPRRAGHATRRAGQAPVRSRPRRARRARHRALGCGDRAGARNGDRGGHGNGLGGSRLDRQPPRRWRRQPRVLHPCAPRGDAPRPLGRPTRTSGMNKLSISFEFFPPNTPVGQDKLRTVCTELATVNPEFFSVTYGAGGAMQEKTFNVVAELAAAGASVAPHLSCVGSTRDAIGALLDRYRELGVDRIVALRGDAPSGFGVGPVGEFRYASDLVTFIRSHSGRAFTVEVAAYPEFHPQARSPSEDMAAFAAKVRAGADRAITQYFYNADAYFRFRDDVVAAGIDVPIVPGIMPITNYAQLARFSDNCGAEIPR